MKKCLFIISLVVCFMASAQAAKILVWNFNPDGHDTITDPEVGFRIDCGYWLKTCLTNNSYTFTYHDNLNLPADISSYDVIVATFGYPTCWSDHSNMDPADQTKLIGFLNQGKSLYIEGDFGYFVQNTEFYKMLGCTYLDGGDSTASVMSFSGQNSTIAEGAQLTYLPTNYYWYITRYIDELGSNGSKMIFKCNFNKNRAATYEGKNGTYRVIYSAFVFMGIRGKDVKDKLMKKYVDYLLGVSPIVKEYDKLKIISSTCFDLNPYIIKNRISFILNQPTKIQADIFSIKGQLMRNIINENLYQGNHVFTLNLNDDNLSGSGRYILRFKADEETVNKVFILAK